MKRGQKLGEGKTETKIQIGSEKNLRKINFKKILPFIVIVLIAIIVIIAYPIFFGSKSRGQQEVHQSQIGGKSQPVRTRVDVTEIVPQHITSLLNSMKAYELHNPPLSKDTPKIKTIVGERIFSSEVKKKVITTTEGDTEKPDIIISSDKETFLDVINSGNAKAAIEQGVNSGIIQIEMTASKTRLFFKGYLSLYKEITGKELKDLL